MDGFIVLRFSMFSSLTMKPAVNRYQSDSNAQSPAIVPLDWRVRITATIFVAIFAVAFCGASMARAADGLASISADSGGVESRERRIGRQDLTTETVEGQSLSTDAAIEIIASGASHSKSIMAAFRFERSEDKNFDNFPDGWTRWRDSQHPPYLPMKIVAHNPKSLEMTRAIDRFMLGPWEKARSQIGALPPLPPSASDWLIDHYLRIELDGGAAMLQSPTIPFDPNFRYQLSGRLFTDRLRHNHAFGELVFLNAAGEVVRTERSDKYSGTRAWTPWKTEMSASPSGAVGMAIRLHLTPQQWGKDRDIFGAAGFDDLIVVQVPRVRVETDKRLALYLPGDQPVIRMRVMGLKDTTNTARFKVVDSTGRQVASDEQPFRLEEVVVGKDRQPVPKPAPAGPVLGYESFEAAFLADKVAQASDRPARVRPQVLGLSDKTAGAQAAEDQPQALVEIEATAQWKLPPLKPGFYTIQSGLIENGREWLRTETTVAVLADLPVQAAWGPFGWTLPDGIGDIELKFVSDWLKSSGVSAVKYPFWIAPDDRVGLDNAAWLTERLKEAEIRCIGLLARPPTAIQAIIDEREKRQPVAANLFRDSRVWQPLLEPLMTRLTIRVQTWQLGFDGDHSFIGRPQLPEVIAEITRELQGYGQPIGVAISWPWLDIFPPEVGAVAAAVGRAADDPYTADELDAALQSVASEPMLPVETSKQRSRSENWLNIDPLDNTKYDLDTRITDLLVRMGTVRGHAVAGAFISNPRDRRRGVLRSDWRPDDLFLPWRTAAIMLGDVARVGAIDQDYAGSNMVFANNSRTMMMLWSPEPSTVDIYVGKDTKQIDSWGRQTAAEKVNVDGELKHRFRLDRTPVFLIDLDPVIVSMRMTTRLAEDRIDSLLGRRQQVRLLIRNPTSSPLSGTVALTQPNDWIVESPAQTFEMMPGEERELDFAVILRNSARIGEVPLKFQFVLGSEPARRFTIQRKIAVGPEGLDVEVTTKQLDSALVVQLQLRNRSDRDQQYDCLLFPPDGRQYQRHQIDVAAGTTVRRDFTLQDAQSLIGKTMLLRAVEQGGGRILNQSITVTR